MTVLELWGDKTGAILGVGPTITGEAFLELAHSDNACSYEGLSLQFRVSDIRAAVEKLRGKIDFRGPTKRPWGSTYIYLKDPSGIQVILYQGKTVAFVSGRIVF